VEHYLLEASGLIDALVKVSVRFQFPLGVEWVKSADTLAPISFARSRTTLKEIVQTVASAYRGHDWRDENGVLYVFQRDLTKDSRNPLNVTIKAIAFTETVGIVSNTLFQIVTTRFVRRNCTASLVVFPATPASLFSASKLRTLQHGLC
jgi:hypothetical protein